MTYPTFVHPVSPPLAVAHRAHDLTLALPEDTKMVRGLFWLFVVLPAVPVALAAGLLAAAATLPLQVLAAILVGGAVARWRRCGLATVASMPVTGLGLVWGALALL